MPKILFSLEKHYIHPDGICSSIACHDTGVPNKDLAVLISLSWEAFSSSTHFKFWCWSFCSAGLHSTKCTCNDSMKFLNFEAPYKKLKTFICSWECKQEVYTEIQAKSTSSYAKEIGHECSSSGAKLNQIYSLRLAHLLPKTHHPDTNHLCLRKQGIRITIIVMMNRDSLLCFFVLSFVECYKHTDAGVLKIF